MREQACTVPEDIKEGIVFDRVGVGDDRNMLAGQLN
jgi:hypothetical protein